MFAYHMQNLNTFGCGCLCLIELAKRNGRDITEADFLNEFSRKYASWFRRTGITNIFSLLEIGKSLGIVNSAKITIDKDEIIKYQNLYEDRRINGILVFTERMPVSGQLSHIEHCMLLLAADLTTFKVWCPYQDSTNTEESLNWNNWKDWMMHGLILLP